MPRNQLRAVAPSAGQHSSATSITATVDPTKTWNTWDGWGSSLAWWARAIGGTRNADIYADLIYRTSDISVGEEKYPGLGFNIARYNVGGGGIKQPLERKSPQMPWFRDIHGYWTDPANHTLIDLILSRPHERHTAIPMP